MSRRLYRTWIDMKARCYRPTCHNYPNYGERGVRVCDEWLHDFSAFRTWALSAGYNDTLTIDRKDSNDHYTPENCRWITFDANRRKRKNGGAPLDGRIMETVNFPAELERKIERDAKANHRSFNGQVLFLVERALASEAVR